MHVSINWYNLQGRQVDKISIKMSKYNTAKPVLEILATYIPAHPICSKRLSETPYVIGKG